mmetsp:Transcript_21678/g.30381  ORF Transcript_21678/g.30381 Transcript_21678/m.30381 type:complete len:116 (+) Transcript_21678:346-693(+)
MKMSNTSFSFFLTVFLFRRDHTTEKLHLREVKTGLSLVRWPGNIDSDVSVRPPAIDLEMPESIFVCDGGVVGVGSQCNPSDVVVGNFEPPVSEEMILILMHVVRSGYNLVFFEVK